MSHFPFGAVVGQDEAKLTLAAVEPAIRSKVERRDALSAAGEPSGTLQSVAGRSGPPPHGEQRRPGPARRRR